MVTTFLTKRRTTALAIAFFFVHLLFLSVIVWKTQPWMTGDSPRYFALSDSIQTGRGFGLEGSSGFEPEGMRAPGYPGFVAFCQTVLGDSVFAVVLIQGLLYFASIYLIWKTTVEVFGSETGVFFLFLSSFYPFVMYSVGQVSPEIPTLFLVSAAAFLTLNASMWRITAAAVLIGLSAYFRPNLILLNVVLFLCLIFLSLRNWKKALLVIVTSVIVASPYAVRNYIAFDRFTPLPVVGGMGHSLMSVSWMSKIPLNSLIPYGMRGEINEDVRNSGMLEQIAQINREVGVNENTVFISVEAYPDNETRRKANELLQEGAIQNIRDAPADFAGVVLYNSIRMWFSSQMPPHFPWWLSFLLLATGIGAAFLGLVGVIFTLSEIKYRSNLTILFFVGAMFYHVVTLSWLHTEARYTIPVRLFVLAFAAFGLHRIIGKVNVFYRRVLLED